MANQHPDQISLILEKLLIPAATLIVNAAMTYGVISTQLQWIRADLDRHEHALQAMENRMNIREEK